MRVHILLVVLVAALVAWLPAAADGPSKPAAPASSRDVQDFVFLSDVRPVLVRLHIYNEGKPYQDTWEDFVGYVFKWLDRNKDGSLSRDEIERMPSPSLLFSNPLVGLGGGLRGAPSMDQLDTNKDGVVSPQELGVYFRKNGGSPFELRFSGQQRGRSFGPKGGGAASQPSADLLNERIFNLLDTNKDGKLSREELSRAEEVLLKLDLDDDEMITAKELVPDDDPFGFRAQEALLNQGDNKKPDNAAFVAIAPGESPTALSRSLLARYGTKDGKGGDRKLTQKQLGLDDATFQRLDVDGDGSLDTEELSRFARRPPDIEITVRLGKKAGKEARVEIMSTKDKPEWIVNGLRLKDGGALLDLGVSRFNLQAGSSDTSFGMAYPFEQIYKMQFAAADRDGNGYIDENEAKQSPFFRDTFKMMDADGDGKLYEKEMLAFFAKIQDVQAKAMVGCTSMTVADQGRGLFDLLDTNHDGRLSVREMRNAVKLLDTLDIDNDGCLGKNEIPRSYSLTVQQGFMGSDALNAQKAVFSLFGGDTPTVPKSTRGPRWFREMDRNGDGDVSRREFLGSAEQFKKIDTDGDGLISVEEAERYDAQVRKSKEPKK
jgi:Ca2+-binding EF-hand superfamily protein